jgi:hypothetical protein
MGTLPLPNTNRFVYLPVHLPRIASLGDVNQSQKGATTQSRASAGTDSNGKDSKNIHYESSLDNLGVKREDSSREDARDRDLNVDASPTKSVSRVKLISNSPRASEAKVDGHSSKRPSSTIHEDGVNEDGVKRQKTPKKVDHRNISTLSRRPAINSLVVVQENAKDYVFYDDTEQSNCEITLQYPARNAEEKCYRLI